MAGLLRCSQLNKHPDSLDPKVMPEEKYPNPNTQRNIVLGLQVVSIVTVPLRSTELCHCLPTQAGGPLKWFCSKKRIGKNNITNQN